MATEYYVIHEGTGTILNLSECKIVAVKEGNDEAQENLDNDNCDDLLVNADAVYCENEITLG